MGIFKRNLLEATFLGLIAATCFAFKCDEEVCHQKCFGDDFEILTTRLEFGATFGDYIGLRYGYGEAAAFVAGTLSQNLSFFVDAREFILGNHGDAASIGFGLRSIPQCNRSVWGTNIYYDFREAKREDKIQLNGTDNEFITQHFTRNFSRLGLGFEWFNPYFNSFINVYLPIDKSSYSDLGAIFTYPSTGDFAELQHKFLIRGGLDAEIGKEFCFGRYFSAYSGIGLYCYDHKNFNSLIGPQARLEIGWHEFIKFQFLYTYDRTFHSSFQGKLLFSIPLEVLYSCFSGCGDSCIPCLNAQAVKRNYIPFVEECYCWKWTW